MNVAKSVTEPKFRHELKYLCSAAELKMLEVRLQDVMKPDPHTDETGCYLIRSTYFDDLYDRCLNENESGVSPREKWRVRIYNCSDRRISLECKRKEYGMIQKKSCQISSCFRCSKNKISSSASESVVAPVWGFRLYMVAVGSGVVPVKSQSA